MVLDPCVKRTFYNDSAIFRQKYRQSIISRFSKRKWYVLGLNQKKNASLYTYNVYPLPR